jgi:hypothetical protein
MLIDLETLVSKRIYVQVTICISVQAQCLPNSTLADREALNPQETLQFFLKVLNFPSRITYCWVLIETWGESRAALSGTTRMKDSVDQFFVRAYGTGIWENPGQENLGRDVF